MRAGARAHWSQKPAKPSRPSSRTILISNVAHMGELLTLKQPSRTLKPTLQRCGVVLRVLHTVHV